jgi:hypothetical protein
MTTREVGCIPLFSLPAPFLRLVFLMRSCVATDSYKESSNSESISRGLLIHHSYTLDLQLPLQTNHVRSIHARHRSAGVLRPSRPCHHASLIPFPLSVSLQLDDVCRQYQQLRPDIRWLLPSL